MGLGDGDRVEGAPVGFAGVEEDPGAVVVEVAEAVSDSFDSFDEVVDRFGDPVRVVAQVVRQDL